MIKMSYLNKRLASLGVATALTLTMSSCSVSEEKKLGNLNESSIEVMLDDNSNKEINTLEVKDNFEEKEIMEESPEPEYVFDPNAPIVVPFETVTMENGEIGYKIPQFYYPYLVDKNFPVPGMTAVLEVTDEYEILSGCDMINPDGTTTYCSFEGSVGIYKPYWLLLSLDREQCDEEELQLIAKVENLIEEVYYDKTKTNTKK